MPMKPQETISKPDQLVERLRAFDAFTLTTVEGANAAIDVADQAADEIQRLTADLDRAVFYRNQWFAAYRTMINGILDVGGPMCRECADNHGTCPNTGEPCDTSEAVVHRFKSAEAALTRMEIENEALKRQSSGDAGPIAPAAGEAEPSGPMKPFYNGLTGEYIGHAYVLASDGPCKSEGGAS